MKGRIVGIHIIVLLFIVGIIFSHIYACVCDSYNNIFSIITYTISLSLFLNLCLNKTLIFSKCCKSIIYAIFFLCGASNYILLDEANNGNLFYSSADKNLFESYSSTDEIESSRDYRSSFKNSKEQQKSRILENSKQQKKSRTRKNSLREQINEQVSKKIARIAPNREENSILLAITLGNKSILSREQKEAFSSSGAMHILALSGLHISILFTLFKALLFCFNFSYSSRRIKLFILFVCIIFYGYITGFNTSVQRAIIMIIIYYICVLYGRKYNKSTALCLAAFIILCLSPSLLFSIGFQLSFAAIIGIFYIFPTVNNSLEPIINKVNNIFFLETTPIMYIGSSKSKISVTTLYLLRGLFRCALKAIHFISKYLCNTISLSIACQITTLPLCLYYFGSSSNYFIITNLLAIPLATNILYLFVFSFILYPIPFIGDFIANILVCNIKLLNIVVDIFA